MKSSETVVKWLDEQIINYKRSIENNSDVDLKNQIQGAIDMAIQTKTFIKEDKWKA